MSLLDNVRKNRPPKSSLLWLRVVSKGGQRHLPECSSDALFQSSGAYTTSNITTKRQHPWDRLVQVVLSGRCMVAERTDSDDLSGMGNLKSSLQKLSSPIILSGTWPVKILR